MVLRYEQSKELTKCNIDVTYENIEKSGKNYSWYSPVQEVSKSFMKIKILIF
jgi:hypothetical protein